MRLSLNTHLRNGHTKLATRNRTQEINRARQLGQIG
jgi:DNA-binding CsgD family transcriptional regulator